jgi:hypothetical protein
MQLLQSKQVTEQSPGLLESPYRSAAIKELCTICRAPAFVRCPTCGRLFCSQHGSFAECCADCDIELARVESRAFTRSILGFSMAGAAGFAYACHTLGFSFFFPDLIPHPFYLGTLLPVSEGFVIYFASSLCRTIARRRFYRRLGHRSLFVEGAKIAIAPSSPEDEIEVIERRGGWVSKTYGDLPQVPLWQRTYWF